MKAKALILITFCAVVLTSNCHARVVSWDDLGRQMAVIKKGIAEIEREAKAGHNVKMQTKRLERETEDLKRQAVLFVARNIFDGSPNVERPHAFLAKNITLMPGGVYVLMAYTDDYAYSISVKNFQVQIIVKMHLETQVMQTIFEQKVI